MKISIKYLLAISFIILIMLSSCNSELEDKVSNTYQKPTNSGEVIKAIESETVAKADSEEEQLYLENSYFIDYQPNINASSSKKNNGNISYDVKNIHDGNLDTAWINGSDDYGIGEFVEFIFNKSNESQTISFIDICNGNRKTKSLWDANSRVKKIKLWENDEVYAILNLKDTMDIQKFLIEPAIIVKPDETLKLKFEIIDVYKGTKDKDTSITEIDLGSGI